PWLLTDPLDRVIAVLSFIVVWDEDPFRGPAPAAVLEHGNIPRGRKALGVCSAVILAIGGPQQQDRALCQRRIPVHCGRERHGITHRYSKRRRREGCAVGPNSAGGGREGA